MKDIEGFEGLYAATEDGRVWSYPKSHPIGNGGFKNTKGHFVVTRHKTNKGYITVKLANGDRGKTYSLHRVIAKTFVSNPDDFPQVNHKNGNKDDNRAINLEWCTNQQNRDHAIRLGLHKNPPKAWGNHFGKEAAERRRLQG